MLLMIDSTCSSGIPTELTSFANPLSGIAVGLRFQFESVLRGIPVFLLTAERLTGWILFPKIRVDASVSGSLSNERGMLILPFCECFERNFQEVSHFDDVVKTEASVSGLPIRENGLRDARRSGNVGGSQPLFLKQFLKLLVHFLTSSLI